MEFLPALIMGLVGNLHCLGMCGPIALAVPHFSENRAGVIVDDLLYNSGRIITYGILGLIVGFVGMPVAMSKYQGVISIIVGVLLLIYLFIPANLKSKFTSVGMSRKISNAFKNKFRHLLNVNSRSSLFVLGLMNGLLPCGLVYVALFASVASFNPIKSMIFMLIFGVGTTPIMFSVFYLKKIINLKFRSKLRRIVPIGIGLVAILLIMRGMELGIPYISPDLSNPHKMEKMMHH